MLKEFEYKGKAMGTEYNIAIVCDSAKIADKMHKIAKNDIALYEARFSRFSPESELSMLNEKKNMVVSRNFFYITLKAYELFSLTKGIFNPLVQVSRLGYDKNFIEIENKNFIDESPYDIDFSSVVIDQQSFHIQLNEGQKLDYGGFLKGYLSEILAKKIKSYSSKIYGVIVNLGGDIYTEGLDKNGNKFIFNIYNPVKKGEDIMVPLYNQGLATSGTYKRSWFKDDKRIHHILDSTGKQNPNSDIVSASVIYEDGAITEAFTKVFMSMNYESALKLIGEKDVSFVVIKNDGQIIKNI
jgi:thiamine biosynthesis lipoprotein